MGGFVLGGLDLGCFGRGLSGFGLEFGDGGVVFGFGVIFQNDFLCCPEADDHVFDGGNVCLALTDFFAGFLALLICFSATSSEYFLIISHTAFTPPSSCFR